MSLTNTKGNYSSKVRLGNWSEDQYGRELATQPRRQENIVSLAQESYPRHPTSVYSNKATPSGTRDSGATFSEMFGHRGAATGKDQFQTSDPISGKNRHSNAKRRKAKAVRLEKASPYTTVKSATEADFKKSAARTLRATGQSVVGSQDKANARSQSFTKQFSQGVGLRS